MQRTVLINGLDFTDCFDPRYSVTYPRVQGQNAGLMLSGTYTDVIIAQRGRFSRQKEGVFDGRAGVRPEEKGISFRHAGSRHEEKGIRSGRAATCPEYERAAENRARLRLPGKDQHEALQRAEKAFMKTVAIL